MTYEATEISDSLNSPIEMYEFNQKNVEIFRYTSNSGDVSYGGFTYTAIPMKRSRIEQSQDIGRASLKVQMDRTIPLVTQYVAAPPSNVINLTIYRYHRLDPDLEVITLWKGRIVDVDFQKDSCQLLCDPFITAMHRPMLRRLYQVGCPHLLYRTACGIDEATYRQNATITGISGLIITSTTFGTESNGYWTGGLIRIELNGMSHARAILAHSGNDIEIDITIPGLAVDDVLQSAPGCDRTLSTCVSKFSNEENYGGYPYIPSKNPMGGGTLIW